MDVKWSERMQQSGKTPFKQIDVSSDSDWNTFDKVATYLEYKIAGVWTKKLDGPDQRYWDFTSGGGRITLHLEHYLGIMIFPTDFEAVDENSATLLNKVFLELVNYD